MSPQTFVTRCMRVILAPSDALPVRARRPSCAPPVLAPVAVRPTCLLYPQCAAPVHASTGPRRRHHPSARIRPPTTQRHPSVPVSTAA